MSSLFIAGLKEARKLIECGCGVEELDSLIAAYEADESGAPLAESDG